MGKVFTGSKDITGNVSLELVFTGPGEIGLLTIWKDVDGGTVQLFDNDGVAIFPAGITDYGGSFHCPKKLWNGCKITTTGFVGGRLTLFYDKYTA